jgi:hypothetical protein
MSEFVPGMRVGGPIAENMRRIHEAAQRVPVTVAEAPDPAVELALMEAEAEPQPASVPDVPDATNILEPEAAPVLQVVDIREPETAEPMVIDLRNVQQQTEQPEQAKPRHELLTDEHFEAHLKDMMFEISKHTNVQDGRNAAMHEYVDKEPNENLKRFGKLLLMAPEMAVKEHEKQALQDRLSGKQWTTAAEFADAAKMRKLKDELIGFNHLLGGVVADHEAAMPPRKLKGWLNQASHDADFSSRVVNGVQADLAAGKLLLDVPEVEGIRHGNIQEDRKGKDYVFDATPAGIESLDVKMREHFEGVMPVEMDTEGHVVLNLAPSTLDPNGYEVLSKFQSGYRDALIMVLVKGESLHPEEEPVLDIYADEDPDGPGEAAVATPQGKVPRRHQKGKAR